MFFHLSKLLFSGYLQFKDNFVRGQNNSKYRGQKLGSFTLFETPFHVVLMSLLFLLVTVVVLRIQSLEQSL